MDITFGKRRKRGHENDYKPVYFPTLARLDERTGDGRLIESAGFGVRDLPLSLRAQFKDDFGHMGADLVGRLDAVRVSGPNVEGWGWFSDTPEGRKAYDAVSDGSLRGNSIDMADVKVKVKIDWGDEEPDFDEWFTPVDVMVNFTESRIAATTLVATPAFATAYAIIEDEDEDAELVASLVVTEVNILQPEPDLTASVMVQAPWEAFFTEETDTLCPLTVTDEGHVFGHLAQWGSCHTGWQNQCVIVPHSVSNYGHFNVSPIPTTEGRVRTGPIFLLGGHEATAEYVNKAVADVANVWADVRLTDGKLGPWVSGYVRPGTAPEKVYAGQASRISGHWKREGRDLELYAIASVCAAGFDTPYLEAEYDDEGVTYLAASLVPCPSEPMSEDETNVLMHKLLDLELALEEDDG